jgi:hypothetical protein
MRKPLVVLIVGLTAIALLAAPAEAETVVLTTHQSAFDPGGSPNQGWWASALENRSANANYLVGFEGLFNRLDEHRNFFTFDLSTVSRPVVAATLEVQRRRGFGGPTETLGFFDVLTDAATLNDNTGTNSSIFADLGEGKAYGTFEVTTTGDPSQFLQFPLNETAISDINATRGGFFSVGGRLLSLTPEQTDQEFLFGSSEPPPPARLVLVVADVPQSSSDCKNGGWRNVTDDAGQPFRNQGQCVSFVVRASQAA